MAEENGSGRLDRIEALLEKAAEKIDKVVTMGYIHDEKLSRLETNMELHDEKLSRLEANMGLQDEKLSRIEDILADSAKQQKERDKVLDERIEKLVSAMGEFLRRTPAV